MRRDGNPLAPVLAAVAEEAAAAGTVAYLVGGAIRDLLLGAIPDDLDVVVPGGAGAVGRIGGALVQRPGFQPGQSHERFGTAHLEGPGGVSVDLAMARTETYPRPGALPVVEAASSIEADLGRRDFTIHALARPVLQGGALGELVDLFGGAADLERRDLRLLHARSLADDPTRALRGACYAARLSLAPDAGFAEALDLSRSAGAWANVSGDRLRRGLETIVEHPTAAAGIDWLRRWGVLDDIVPGWGGSAPGLLGGPHPWPSLLRPLPGPLRAAVADRLQFTRRLRREVGG